MKSKWTALLALVFVAATAAGGSMYLQPLVTGGTLTGTALDDNSAADLPRRAVICSGRVEAVGGEVDVASVIGGRLEEVRVREGEAVKQGQVLAVLEGQRQKADGAVAQENVRLAKAKLTRLIAGNGGEEIAQALAAAKAVEAELIYERRSLERFRALGAKAVITREELDQKRQRVEHLEHQWESQRKHHEALVRGPIREEIETARAELSLAEAQLAKCQVELDLLLVRAPTAGTVLKLYRHSGDSVLIDDITPILRLANTSHLQIRLEIDEADVTHVGTGLRGGFKVRGVAGTAGNLTVKTIVPAFGPKRLFNPDASARHDGRTLEVLCDVQGRIPLFPGQRVTAEFPISEPIKHHDVSRSRHQDPQP